MHIPLFSRRARNRMCSRKHKEKTSGVTENSSRGRQYKLKVLYISPTCPGIRRNGRKIMVRASVLLLLVLGIVAQASAYRFRYLKPGGPPLRDTMPPPMYPNGYYPVGVVVPMPRGGGVAPEYYPTDNIGEMPGVTYMPPLAI
uniref:Uncharacterized protein n=1 Tax=Rhipicephalus zambeziensis TaxID=60191 RepID=A0A224YF52_9ACAR